MLKIRNTLAIKMLEACGLRTPSLWSLGRIHGKLVSLDNFLSEDKWKDLKSPKQIKLFKRCWKASINREKDVMVYDDKQVYGPQGLINLNERENEMAEKKKKVVRRKRKTEGVTAKTKKAEGVTAKTKKAEGVTAKTKTSAKKSRFGHRIGSQAADIDAILSKKPQSLGTITKAAKVPEKRARNYLRYAIRKGFVATTKKGEYKIA